MEKIILEIDGKHITADAETTVLQAAIANNIKIPTLCYHPDLPTRSSCRLCVVEIEGGKGPVTACNTKVCEGMKVTTISDTLLKLRRTNLELICGEHKLECMACPRNVNCQILPLAKELQANINKFSKRAKKEKLIYGNSLCLDRDKCIECGNCVIACQNLAVNYLKLDGNGVNTKVQAKPLQSCISCGQCSLHCPVGAIETIDSINVVKKALADKRIKVAIQFAPSIRVSIGQEFKVAPDVVMTGQLIAAIRRLNPKWVVDTSIGADFTTVAEAMELVERIKTGENLPMFTSCCPAWVNYVEFYRPDLIPNLTTVRSPHIIMGGLTKHVFAKRTNIKPENVFVVSIMPCVAKKTEIERDVLNYKGLKPVDAVLTTREFARLLREKHINPVDLEPEKSDSPLGLESGSGVIYGASGGVMEAALRSAYKFITGKELKNIDFMTVRGMKEVKEAEIEIGDRKVKVAVVNGHQNVTAILRKIKENPKLYDYLEIMSCRGGCIGGGGNPIPIDDEIRNKRQQAIYGIDKNNEIRLAHENPIVKEVFRNELKSHQLKSHLLETSFSKKISTPIKIITD